MITNTAPAKMVFQNIVTGYTLMNIQHSIHTDQDVYGKSFWLTSGDKVDRRDFSDVNTFSATINRLTPGTTYKVQGAFYDAIIDSALRDAKISINLSDEATAKMKVAPKITAAYSKSQQVEVGVGFPLVFIETTGEADAVTIELKSTATASEPWEIAYKGPLEPIIQFGGIAIGNYKVRIAGQISMPDGSSVDSSGWFEFAGTLEVKYSFIPPTAPSNILFKVARIQDGKERYDLRVEWDWVKGNGANAREFILRYVDSATYAASGFTKAQVLNTGASQKATITSFPFNESYRFQVSTLAWGPEDQNQTHSIVKEFIITKDTPLDSSFTNETGIELNYAHIKAKMNDAGTWRQTFFVDAATGAVVIGIPDATGTAPFSFDPVKKILNVDGKVITKSINAASFILTNLTGQENPAIYSQGKAYGDNNSGVWMGIDNSTGRPKVDIGNGTQYIRYDGTTLRISSKVVVGTPTGDVDLATGMQGKQTVFIYQLATSLPAKPTAADYPPAGWSKTPPNRQNNTQNVYASTGTLDPVTNKLLVGTSWSDVVQWSGTEGVDGKPGTPGTPGSDGQRGPGLYAQGIAGLTGFNASSANSFFTSNFGKPQVKYDVITQYNSNAPQNAWTMQWNGSAWAAPAMVVHGNMIVTGTITSDKIVASNAFLSQIGVNIIYDRAAALSSNPESSYKMKIDLQNGYMHIR